MIDFKKRLKTPARIDTSSRLAVFESLDRRASHTTLRDTQQEALAELSQRRNDRDIVLKLSTGSGKTTIALVHLYAHMLESRHPCVYLCPRKQLVQQVLAEARSLGLPAAEYPAGESIPSSAGQRGEEILVCTYDKMFNAQSTFLRDDVRMVPHAIVLDDAHAGVEEVRDGYTLRLSAGSDEHAAAMKTLHAARTYHPQKWIYIDRGEADAMLEVPFWIWKDVRSAFATALSAYAGKTPYKFVWPHLQDHLGLCRCFVSGQAIEVVPILPFVDRFEPYAGAKHRLFTSATLADDSVLVRELGCSREAAAAPIVPASDAGIGERMVLAPALIDKRLDRHWIMDWCRRVCSHFRVVVLCPSEQRAQEWAAFGARAVIREEVDEAVNGLRAGTEDFVAFAQRYDGVDLPDDACRILVIDGLPHAKGLADACDSAGSVRSGVAVRPVVHRIEQGMGRAVRSHVDYAVVLLAGEELASFISHRDAEAHMGAATRAQVDLAYELAKIANEDDLESRGPVALLQELVGKCLRRDDGWKNYYDQSVRQVAKNSLREVDQAAIDAAAAEREALGHALRGNGPSAATALQPAVAAADDPTTRGLRLQTLATYQAMYNQADALATQAKAHAENPRTCVPPVVQPSSRRGATTAQPQAVAVIRWYLTFSKPRAVIAEAASLRYRLVFGESASSEAFEAALRKLGEILGAVSTRPEAEFRRGPDNLFDWPPCAWVIEAKNQRGVLPREDGKQLLSSLQWFQDHQPERPEVVPVVVADVAAAEWDAEFPPETRIIDKKLLDKLLGKVEDFVRELANMDPGGEGEAERVKALLLKHSLGQEQLAGKFSRKLTKKPRP